MVLLEARNMDYMSARQSRCGLDRVNFICDTGRLTQDVVRALAAYTFSVRQATWSLFV